MMWLPTSRGGGGGREGDMAVGVWKIMSQGGKINGD